jgi:hypothetical protein
MRALRDEPVLTETFSAAAQFRPSPGSFYFYARSPEARSSHVDSWKLTASAVVFKEVLKESPDSFELTGGVEVYWLRNASSLNSIFSVMAHGSVVYLDITGLSHSVWAALLRAALLSDVEVRVVYVEPYAYSRSTTPVEGQIYDLSSRITGIAPLPGYAILSSPPDSLFVPLLGFEGTRFRHLIEQVQPMAGRMIPIIGSPGFKPWYVFETYKGNRAALVEESAWQAVRYAPANCPFGCFYLLNEIAASAPGNSLKIAPIGTKPHALGAVLYALNSTAVTELIYDHPIRKQGRTDGTSRLLVYHVSSLVQAGMRAKALQRSQRA